MESTIKKDVNIKVVNITPGMAKEWLEKYNNRNRPFKKETARKYAEMMASGDWDYGNCQSISFAKDGTLLDGQHRLAAIVKSGKAGKFVVNRGLENDTIVFDRGVGRTTRDVVVLNGDADTKIPNSIISTVKAIYEHIVGQPHMTDAKIGRYINAHYTELSKAATIAATGGKNAILRKSSAAAAIFFALRSGVSEEVIERFAKVVNTGFSANDNEFTAIVCRNMLLEWKGQHTKTYRSATIYLVERAISDFDKKRKRTTKYPLKQLETGVYSEEIMKEDIKELK